jgi:hypothetical protein
LEHTVFCWSCSTPYDVFEAAWCGCSLSSPTKICPFCYTCACGAAPSYLEQFRRDLPMELRDQLGTLNQPRKRIGELLVERGRITDEQLGELLEQQRTSGIRLGDILVLRGLASREEVSRHLAEQQELQTVDIDPKALNLNLILSVGPKLCLQHGIVPLDSQEFSHLKMLIVAVSDPLTPAQLEVLGEKISYKIYQKFAPAEQIRLALEKITKLMVLSARRQGS